LRIGVGHPGVKEAVPHYVLHDFAKADRDWLEPLIAAIADNAPLLAEGKDATFANRLHAATQPQNPDRPPEKKSKPDKDLAGSAESKPQAPQASDEAPRPAEGPFAGALRKLFGG
jgi:PTH1 family peptidyl-tRNA hydrolase